MSCFRRRRVPKSESAPVLPTLPLIDTRRIMSAPILSLPGTAVRQMILISPSYDLSLVDEGALSDFVNPPFVNYQLGAETDLLLIFGQDHFFTIAPVQYPWTVKSENVIATRLIRYLSDTTCVYNDIAVTGYAAIISEKGLNWEDWLRIEMNLKTRQIRTTNEFIPVKRYIYHCRHF